VPLLVISDGAAGLIGAIDTHMSGALRQRCLIHRARNVLAKVPAEHRDQIKAAFWEIFDLDAGDDGDIEPRRTRRACRTSPDRRLRPPL
jgi:transposase-like protein